MKIAVLGAGSMGSGIAQVAAMAGNQVYLFDSFPESLTKAKEQISSSFDKLVSKGKIQQSELSPLQESIAFIHTLEDIADTEFVIEAIIEDEAAKKNLFTQIELIVSNQTVIATNTSSLSVTGLARVLKGPERFIGIHFFNPPVLMKLVEIIPALQTSEHLVGWCSELISSWGKTVVVARDTPGFIVNRIARPFYGESLRIVEEQLATYAQVDHAMKHAGFKMGPFELMDFIGNDINEAVTRSVWTSMHFDGRYKPSALQMNLVRAGWLGRKTGRGYYDYKNGEGAIEKEQGVTMSSEIMNRILVMLINEAAEACYLGIASRDDIDLAMIHGVNYPKGLLKWADEIGIQNCVNAMDTLYHTYHEERYRCSPLLRRMASSGKTFYS